MSRRPPAPPLTTTVCPFAHRSIVRPVLQADHPPTKKAERRWSAPGAAQALAAANISLAAIMEHGRWQSSMMPARYTRHASAAQSAMTKLYQEN